MEQFHIFNVIKYFKILQYKNGLYLQGFKDHRGLFKMNYFKLSNF